MKVVEPSEGMKVVELRKVIEGASGTGHVSPTQAASPITAAKRLISVIKITIQAVRDRWLNGSIFYSAPAKRVFLISDRLTILSGEGTGVRRPAIHICNEISNGENSFCQITKQIEIAGFVIVVLCLAFVQRPRTSSTSHASTISCSIRQIRSRSGNSSENARVLCFCDILNLWVAPTTSVSFSFVSRFDE